MSILDRIPELVCPKCKSSFSESPSQRALSCSGCGRDYRVEEGIPNMLAEEDLDSFSEEIAVQDSVASDYVLKRYQEPYSKRYHLWWTDEMLKPVPTEGRILDNGCGVGHLFERVPSERVVGLDISREMLRFASRHSDQLILGNSQELPLKDSCFDVVFCRSLLHHLPNPGLGVQEMYRILRQGGEAVLVETNKSLLSFLPRMLSRKGEHFSETHQNLSLSILRQMLNPYFEIDEVAYFGYIAYPLLGFPDMLPIFRFFPFKKATERALMIVDKTLSKVPGVRTQSWGLLLKVSRK